MHRRVRPYQRIHWCNDAHKTSHTLCGPSVRIRELRKYRVRGLKICSWCAHPQRDQDGEEAEDMENEHDLLNKRKLMCEERIKDEGDDGDCNDH